MRSTVSPGPSEGGAGEGRGGWMQKGSGLQRETGGLRSAYGRPGPLTRKSCGLGLAPQAGGHGELDEAVQAVAGVAGER